MPLSPSETRSLLAQLDHHPKRFLGQNFLVDGNIVRKSLELAEITTGDRVVEIGPGLGTLTSALLEAGAEVWAVEKDRTLYSHLTATLLPRFPERLHLVEGDAVELPLAGLDEVMPLPSQLTGENGGAAPSPRLDASRAVGAPHLQANSSRLDFKIVANLPYAIATPWLDAVLSGPLPERMVLMLQQEAAQRYVAKHGSKAFGAISVFLQSAFNVAPGHKVEANCFHPRPDVDSYLLHLVRKTDPFIFPASIKELIRSIFQQRRKQIGGLLRERLPDHGKDWLAFLAGAGFSAQTRPEDIPLELWRGLVVGES
jgi:16S rRNA (adenine1518-N6/adenine1519-N6)-dimethyltransferase